MDDIALPFDASPQLLAIAAVVVVLIVARRSRVVRWVTSLALWGTLAAVLVFTVGERSRFDPYLRALVGDYIPETQTTVGDEVRVRLSRDGHFWVKARIGAVERRLLIDSGATISAITPETALAGGVETRASVVPVIMQTANGAVRAQTGTIDRIDVGGIVTRDLPVVVLPARGVPDLLGMNFLRQLKSWRVEGDTLIMVPGTREAASTDNARRG